MADERTLTVPGRLEMLAQISDFVSQAARDAGFDEDDVFHVQMAVDEACANIIEHGYGPNNSGTIDLTCICDKDSDLYVEIRDRGRRFDPDRALPPHLDKGDVDLGEVQAGGLGLYFIRKLMEEVTFQFDEASGNRLTMVKRRPR